MVIEPQKRELIFDAILSANPNQIFRVVKEWIIGIGLHQDIELQAKLSGKYQDRINIYFKRDGERSRNAGGVFMHGALSSTHVTVSFWDWENHGESWAEWNGFATLPGAKKVFESLADELRRKISVLKDNLNVIEAVQNGQPQGDVVFPETPKRKAPYRLSKSDINYRIRKVEEAEAMREDTNLHWKVIAMNIGVPHNTLKDWRHNPTYNKKRNQRKKVQR